LNLIDCLFCRIAAKEIPSQPVYEDELVLAFHDINPAAPVHILLIPKQHISSLAEVTEQDQTLLGHLQVRASQIAREVGIEANGYRLVTNIGEDGGQTISHLHYHLLGQRLMQWPPG
jgi:histidine triad (HIT) family protein